MKRDTKRVAVLAGIAAGLLLAAACGPQTGNRSAQPTPRATPGLAVVTTWVADPAVTVAPYPGFRPRLTGLTSAMVLSAVPGPDPNGGDQWWVTVTLDPAGSTLMSRLSTDAVHACGRSYSDGCPPGHLTWWLALTQADVDGWNALASGLYQTVNKGGKLLTDPIVLIPITDGTVNVGVPGSGEQAKAVATRMHG